MDEFFMEMSKLRDHVNDPALDLFEQLSAEAWNTLCSGMDALEDTHNAVEAFVNPSSQLRSLGERYLRVYGVLQALTVQQDAVRECCEVLGLGSLCNLEPLTEIRDVRIRAVGHPTLRRKTKDRPRSSHFIVQMSLTDQSFELISADSSEGYKHESISVPDLARKQEQHVVEIMKKIRTELERRSTSVQ